MSPDYPRHLRGFTYLGRHRYFLTFCTFRRRNLFVAPRLVDAVLGHFRQAAIAQRIAILAYCFMPDHLHLLVEGMSECSSLLEFVNGAKQRSGFTVSKRFGARLWQRYGYERVLRKDESARSVAAYVVANPVRARLVEDVRQYPYVGSDVYAMEDLIEVFRDGRTG